MSQVFGPSLLPGAQTFGSGGLGALGAVIRAKTGSGAHGPGYLYNDWDSAADDAKEFRGVVETAPVAGMLLAAEDGSFTFSGAPDGSYSFSYRLYVDGVDLGLATAYLSVGVASLAPVSGAGSIPSGEAFGVPGISGSGGMASTVTGAGNIGSTEAFGPPSASVISVANVSDAAGIDSSEVFGLPNVSVTQAAPATTYATIQSLSGRFGLEELIQMTNPTDPTAEDVGISRAEDAIADVDALIDAKLQARYGLPLKSVPRLLRNIACDLVRARIYADRITDHVADRERAALKLLDQIASGQVGLGLDDAAQATPPTEGPQFNAPTQPVFTAAALRDYAP